MDAVFLFIHFAFLFSPALTLSGTSRMSNYYIIILNILDAFGGTCSYIVSAIISYAVTYLMIYKKIFDIKKYKYVLTSVVLLPNLIWLPFCLIALDPRYKGELYNTKFTYFEMGYYISTLLRLLPVAFNIICYVVNVFMMRKMINPLQNKLGKSKKHETAIASLVGRLKWYPLLQVAARLFPTWITLNTCTQNYITNKYTCPRYPGYDHYVFSLNLLNIIGQLVAPCGFLIVYLRMQRRKFDILAPRQSLISPKYRIESSQCSIVEEDKKNQIQRGTDEKSSTYTYSKSNSITVSLITNELPPNGTGSATTPPPMSSSVYGHPSHGESPFHHESSGSDYDIDGDDVSRSSNFRATENIDRLDDDTLLDLIAEESNGHGHPSHYSSAL